MVRLLAKGRRASPMPLPVAGLTSCSTAPGAPNELAPATAGGSAPGRKAGTNGDGLMNVLTAGGTPAGGAAWSAVSAGAALLGGPVEGEERERAPRPLGVGTPSQAGKGGGTAQSNCCVVVWPRVVVVLPTGLVMVVVVWKAVLLSRYGLSRYRLAPPKADQPAHLSSHPCCAVAGDTSQTQTKAPQSSNRIVL